jgi:hypothetical protein
MAANGTGQSDDGVAMDPDEPLGLSDAATVVEVGEDGASLLVGEPAIEEGRALAFGEAGLAGVAVEQADVILLAVAVADREVANTASAVQRAVGVMTTEASEVVHGEEPS